MKYLVLTLCLVLTGCFDSDKASEQAHRLVELEACKLGYVTAVQQLNAGTRFLDDKDLLTAASDACLAEMGKVYESIKASGKEVMLQQNLPTISIVDSRDDSRVAFVTVNNCRVEVKKTELKDMDAVVEKVNKLCKLGLSK